MKDKIKEIEKSAIEEIALAANSDSLEKARVKYLGRKGLITELFKNMGGVSPADRAQIGALINSLKETVSKSLDEKVRAISGGPDRGVQKIDITLPGIARETGHIHPISKTIEEICGVFISLGFKVVEGPEIENEHYNFEALNIPLDHPSRDSFDTFYLEEPPDCHSRESGNLNRFPIKAFGNDTSKHFLLRSHTSPVQARFMEKNKPPFAIVIPGKVYRPDATDASHSFMFHQVEGLVVGDNIRFSDLKGTLTLFARQIFGEKTRMRFRPSFFPFTEPSAEVDISCILCSGSTSGRCNDTGPVHDATKSSRAGFNLPYGEEPRRCPLCGGKGWIEILGAGMVNPKVFKNVGYNPEKVTGFAFGMGVERIAILKYGITDIRMFFENDIRFLRQF